MRERQRLGDAAPQQVVEHLVLAALAVRLELDLAAQGAGTLSASPTRATAPLSPSRAARRSAAAATRLGGGDGEAGGDARAGVDRGRLPDGAGEAGDDLEQVLGHLRDELRLLPDEVDLEVDVEGVVGADLGAEPVLERGDDAAAVRVVLGVGAGDEQHVERQPQHVAADLHVALLEHVEQRDLDALGQVGQLVDREDAAVRAGHEPEVDGLGVAQGAALGDLDGVDVADEVADAGVGRGELLGVALVAVHPGDRQGVAELGGAARGGRGDRARTGAR